jgi:imidazolonepropionase-like amidohydrolase
MHSSLPTREVNLKFEAMQGIFSGKQTLVIHTSRSKEIIDAVHFAKSYGIKRIAVAAAEDALQTAAFLKSNGVPVIVPSVHTLPIRDDEDIDLQYSLAALLSKAGIEVSFSHTGSMGTGRNLPFYAGTAIAHGMDREAAIRALTINPAKLLGVDATLGTLEPGKDATFFVSEGDPLDFRTNQLRYAFISGKQIVLPGKHEDLYERFSEKYGHKKN